MIPRRVEPVLRDALADRPVVFLTGPRQSGKTTLAKTLAGRQYFTLDDATVQGAAAADPEGFLEIRKQLGWSSVDADLWHFRTSDGREVDLVLEDRKGRIVGIEVKASSTVRERDLRGMRALAGIAGRKFHRGVILYTGRRVVPFAANTHALPISALWTL